MNNQLPSHPVKDAKALWLTGEDRSHPTPPQLNAKAIPSLKQAADNLKKFYDLTQELVAPPKFEDYFESEIRKQLK